MLKSADHSCYVTTPIYYVTAKPHLGSLYSTLLADVIARWHHIQGYQTFLLTGTDEHGQKIMHAAQKAGKSPKDFVDGFIDAYKDTWHSYDIEYSRFIRTTDKYHVQAVQEWINKLLDQGDIYKSFYEGWYCTPCETFVVERDAQQSGLANHAPVCPSCGRPTAIVAEECYFFRLSAYQDKLLAFYEQNPDFIAPKERIHEVINFVRVGLKDLSISRTTVSWGIPFPNDPRHITYVWADALNNYITAIGYAQKGREQEFAQWWPAHVHVMGKDILRFHAVYWPAFLMATGLALPKRLLVHGWIKVGGQKMSKSFGNAIDPQELCKRYGADAMRYYLLRQLAINQDGEFSIEDLEQRITSDLANDLGNLLNRMILLADKYGIHTVQHPITWSPAALDMRDACWNMIEDVEELMADFEFHHALASIWKFINQVNAYFHAQEPWKLIKHDRAAFLEVLSVTCHSLRSIAVILWPFMPRKMMQLLDMLGVSALSTGPCIKDLELSRWAEQFTLKKDSPLFEKPREVEYAAQATEVTATSTSSNTQSVEQFITIDDVAKVMLVTGTIKAAQAVESSDKLLKLQVDFGAYGLKQVLAGIKKFYEPAVLLEKQAVFVFNLEPRKLMGLMSEGMILTALDEHGMLQLITPTGVVPNGTRLK